MDLGLSGKNVLVTGASQGIGLATAIMLAREGASVAICGRTAASLDEAVELIRSSTGSLVVPTVADVARVEDIDRMIKTVRATLGTIDVLVVNPGHPPTSFEHEFAFTDGDCLVGFEQLVLSAVRMCRLVVPDMAERGWGRVVMVTTLLAREPSPNHVLSGALRACAQAFLKSWATEFGSRGVTFNSVLPGAIDTPRARKTASVAATKQLTNPAQALGIPVGRMGTSDEVAAAVAFLCSSFGSYITGVGLPVDGGVLHGF